MNTKTKLLSALIGAGIITMATATYAARPWYSCLSPKHIKTTEAECFASCTKEQRVWNKVDGTCDPKVEGFVCPVSCGYDDIMKEYRCLGGTGSTDCTPEDNSICCTPENKEKLCATNEDCASDEYCNYRGNFNSNQTPGAVGTCMTVSESTVGSSGDFVLGGRGMDWYSAKNFCARAPGVSRLVTLDEACPGGWGEYEYCSENIKERISYWTANEEGSSYAYYVYDSGIVDVIGKNGYQEYFINWNSFYAVCK